MDMNTKIAMALGIALAFAPLVSRAETFSQYVEHAAVMDTVTLMTAKLHTLSREIDNLRLAKKQDVLKLAVITSKIQKIPPPWGALVAREQRAAYRYRLSLVLDEAGFVGHACKTRAEVVARLDHEWATHRERTIVAAAKIAGIDLEQIHSLETQEQ